MRATRSPGCTPAATRPRATASTSSANWVQLTWLHPPDGRLIENAVSFGASVALRRGSWARLPSVVTGASGATTLSFTDTPGWPGPGCDRHYRAVTVMTTSPSSQHRTPGRAGTPRYGRAVAAILPRRPATAHGAAPPRRDSLRRMADRTESSIVIAAPPGE